MQEMPLSELNFTESQPRFLSRSVINQAMSLQDFVLPFTQGVTLNASRAPDPSRTLWWLS